ncbi:MAG: ABC transporter ATP-binding protein [Caulobacterales bacterium]
MRLEAKELTVIRGGARILNGVSATFAKPELVAVIGPNGAGKSTFLLALAGLLKPDSGAVLFDGAPIAAAPRKALARARAYLPQNARCEWPISVERLVALGLTPTLPAFGSAAPAEENKISHALAQCDLTHKRDQAVTTLSGGELARAMLARAIVSDPGVLIADEPIAGLDPRHALDAMRLLAQTRQREKLVVAALHDLTLAARFADRVIAINEGAIVADGAPDEVFTPAMMRTVFDVEARIERDGEGMNIRLAARG